MIEQDPKKRLQEALEQVDKVQGREGYWANSEKTEEEESKDKQRLNSQILKAVKRLEGESEKMINDVMTANYDKNWKERAEQAREEKNKSDSEAE